eukprot:COSAG02_NODE_490_length_21240_cov_7.601343_5_plen_390_part_00
MSLISVCLCPAVENRWRSQFRIVPVAKYTTLQEDQESGAKNDYVVRGGDYVEIFHRQSQGYLSIDAGDSNSFPAPRLFRPIADSLDADPQSTISAELVWKIMVPRMSWSGTTVTTAAGVRVEGYCLAAAMMSGEELFLAEDAETGKVSLSPDPGDRLSQWLLKPFDNDMRTELGLRYDESKFFLMNLQSGKVLHQGKEHQRGSQSADDPTACFRLQMLDPSQDHESDAFVLHPLGIGAAARQWLKAFQAGEEGLDGLWQFNQEVETILALRKAGKGEGKSHKTRLPHLSLNHHHQGAAAVAAGRAGSDVEERTAMLWAKYVHPPPHHWNEWASPVLNDLRCFINSLVSGIGDDPLQWLGAPDHRQQRILLGLGTIKFIVRLLQVRHVAR